MSWDPYLDLEHGVLHNLLGITDRAELARVEAELTGSRLYDLQRHDLPGQYDLDHLQEFHEHIFGDVYEWAGEGGDRPSAPWSPSRRPWRGARRE